MFFKLEIRSMLSEKIELSGSLQHIDIADETEIAFGLSALYNSTKQFSAGVGYSKAMMLIFFCLSGLFFLTKYETNK